MKSLPIAFVFVMAIGLFSGCTKVEKEEVEKIPDLVGSQVGESVFRMGDKTFTVEPSTKVEFEQYKKILFDTLEANNLKRDAEYVKRVGDTLLFKLENGKFTKLINNPNQEADNYAHYDFMGRMPEINQSVVLGTFYEWYNYYLINHYTGDTTVLSGYPEVSPDHRFIVSGNSDLVAGFTFNGLEFYQMDNKKLKIIDTKQLGTWGPSELFWANNSTLVVQRDLIDTTQESMQRTDYIKLRIK